ncbi:MAG: prolyl aminopeptidase [Nakamurella sp.]
MVDRYPEVLPYRTGMLDVGDGNRLYWELAGNPDGIPAVYLHGGPGSGSPVGARRLFDPARYSTLVFDQRNCGRSTPSAVDPAVSLAANTTAHLIGDIELLRGHLGVDKWVIFCGSWGVTLGLAYAEQHPERVAAAIFASVTMTRPSDVHWLYHEVGRYLPEQWDIFRRGVPESERDGDLVAAYDGLLNGQPDVAVREQAAQRWCDWEAAVLSLEPGFSYPERYLDPTFRMVFARIVAHYFSHAAWLEDGQLLRDAHRLASIPGVLIHGRLDLGGPADTAWQLARAWPHAELHLVGTGHAGGEEMSQRVRDAIEQFARPLRC